MDMLNKWIEFGRPTGDYVNARNIRRWMNEERGRVPVIDRVNYPETGRDCRQFRRG